MYRALVSKDSTYEGIFFACVRTTGIFCRPTCSARKPRPQNVEFVASAAAALRASRLTRHRASPTRTSALWASSPSAPADISSATWGVTFHAYQRAWRLGKAMKHLHTGQHISAVAHDAGFASESGFRDAFTKFLGSPPAKQRASCAASDPLCAHWLTTPLGPMVAIASHAGITLLEFVDRRALEREIAQLRKRFKQPIVPGTNKHIQCVEEELKDYFAGTLRTFRVTIDAKGSEFQQAVWNQLTRINYGETTTYAHIAAQVGKPGASRAVGTANGANTIAIVIPCHRVVRADGSLSGYGGGPWRKQAMLEHEYDHAVGDPNGWASRYTHTTKAHTPALFPEGRSAQPLTPQRQSQPTPTKFP